MIWIALVVFFVVFPAILAFQSGRPWTLAMPVALIAVCAQWVIVDGGGSSDSEGLPGIALGLAILGFLVALYGLELGRRRLRRPPRLKR